MVESAIYFPLIIICVYLVIFVMIKMFALVCTDAETHIKERAKAEKDTVSVSIDEDDEISKNKK
jgi:hypothetical protein